MPLLYLSIFLYVLYASLIIIYRQAWIKAPEYSDSNAGNSVNHVSFSIIIPARNEEKTIGRLLAALEQQIYPRENIEVIVVNDDSTDNTAAVAGKFPTVRLVHLKTEAVRSHKKKALETGIEAATGEWILTTDADCLPRAEWLSTIASFIVKNDPVLVVAPVVYEKQGSLLNIFQSLDFLALQGITGASVHAKMHALCNGANLAYKKSVFKEAGGFSGADKLSSGDDLLLMQKIKKIYPDRIFYLKSGKAIVSTTPPQTWRDFFRQRIRWGSKTGSYNDKKLIASLLLVYLFDFLFLVLAVAGFFNFQYWVYVLILWSLKAAVEYSLVIPVAQFFNRRSLLPWLFVLQPLHILYIVFFGIRSQFGTYEWKGRRVR